MSEQDLRLVERGKKYRKLKDARQWVRNVEYQVVSGFIFGKLSDNLKRQYIKSLVRLSDAHKDMSVHLDECIHSLRMSLKDEEKEE